MAAGFGARSRSPKTAIWAALASTSVAFRKSVMFTPLNSASRSRIVATSAGRAERPFSTGPALRDHKKAEIARLNTIYGNLLSGAKAELIDGRARLVDAHRRRRRGALHGREDPDRHRRLAAHPQVSRQRTGDQLPTRCSTWRSFPSVWRSSAAATSRSSLPESSTVWAPRSASSTVGRCSCAASTMTCAPTPPRNRQEGVDLRFDVNVQAIVKTATGLQVLLTDGTTLEVRRGALRHRTQSQSRRLGSRTSG